MRHTWGVVWALRVALAAAPLPLELELELEPLAADASGTGAAASEAGNKARIADTRENMRGWSPADSASALNSSDSSKASAYPHNSS